MTTSEVMQKLLADPVPAKEAREKEMTIEQLFELFKRNGLTDDFDTFSQAIMEQNESVNELSDEEFDAVAGGNGGETNTKFITVGNGETNPIYITARNKEVVPDLGNFIR